MKHTVEFLKCLVFGLVNVGIACLTMMLIIWLHHPSALGSRSGMDAFLYIMGGKADLHRIGAVFVSVAILFLILGVGGCFSALSVLFFGKEPGHR